MGSYTERDNIRAKDEIIYELSQSGYAPYAKLLSKFYIYLTNDPNTIAAMIPDEFIILINPEKLGYSRKKMNVCIRHEILHQYLDHALRSVEHLGKQVYDNRTPQMHQRLNIAQDYEISDKGYTEADKAIIRELHALLLCDDHPDWQGKTFEEIYDLLGDQIDNETNPQNQQNQNNQNNQHSDEYIAAYNDIIDRFNNGQITAEDIEQWMAENGGNE